MSFCPALTKAHSFPALKGDVTAQWEGTESNLQEATLGRVGAKKKSAQGSSWSHHLLRDRHEASSYNPSHEFKS